MAAGGVAMFSTVLGIVPYVIGAIVARGASHRWQGSGESKIALLCVAAIFAGPLLVLAAGT